MEESHSDINAAFGPHRSVSAQFGDHQLLSSLLEIKNDLSTEVRALTKRMSHIDDQISQIFHFLSPINPSVTDIPPPPIEQRSSSSPPPPPPPSQIPSPSAPLSPLAIAISPETNASSVSMSPLFEAPSFYSDLSSQMTLFDPTQPAPSTTENEQMQTRSLTRQISGHDATGLSIPPASAYNRSASSSIISLGTSTASRGSISNKIAPAPVSPKHPLSTTFQPISNTRYNPGRSPKPKTRSHHGRPSRNRNQQQSPEKSTIIELEPSEQQEVPSKSAPLLGTPIRTVSATRPSGSVFRRFMPGGNNTEKTTMSSSSTLLYPPTSDDERPISPLSSGNEDDDYRPLTSLNKHHHHQTPL